MRGYYGPRAPWHDCYMGYTGNSALEELLAPIVAVVEELLSGRDVLEVACGTGNWTAVLAKRAAGVLETVAGKGEGAEYHEWRELGRWLVTYTVSNAARS